jgi:excisionase family DNA binding protein
VQLVSLDKRALKCLLDLAELGARADGARFAPRTLEVFEHLARSAIAPGDVMISTAGRSFPASTGVGWITVARTAETLNVSKGNVRRLCRTGRLRCRRVGKRIWTIDPDSVEDRRRTA